MPTIEKVLKGVFGDVNYRRKLLIGGLLFYLPIINFLLAGYYFRYVRRLRSGGGVELPEWDDLRGMVMDTIKALLPFLIYGLLPILFGLLLGRAVHGLFSWIGLNFFGATLAYLPLSLALMVAPVLSVGALWRVVHEGHMGAIWDWHTLINPLLKNGRQLILPVLAFWGLCLVGWPVLGFAVFFGAGPLVVLICTLYISGEN